MAAVLVQMIPLGIAAALSPVPIMTGITLAGSVRPTLTLTAYLLGGILAYAVLGVIGIALITKTSQLQSGGHPSTLALSIQLVIGAFFLASALFAAITRRSSGTPRWMKAVERFGPGRAFLAGIVILSPRVKNLLLLAAALNLIGESRLGPISAAVAVLIFMALTLSPVLAPLTIHLTETPQRAIATTDVWKNWLARHNQTILILVFGVMGVKLVADALAELLS